MSGVGFILIIERNEWKAYLMGPENRARWTIFEIYTFVGGRRFFPSSFSFLCRTFSISCCPYF